MVSLQFVVWIGYIYGYVVSQVVQFSITCRLDILLFVVLALNFSYADDLDINFS